MMGKTHALGGSVCALAGYLILKKSGMLVDGVEPLLQFPIIYAAALVGAKAPDYDHHVDSMPSQDPIAITFNRILHFFNPMYKMIEEKKIKVNKKSFKYKFIKSMRCVHRAWQTHSIEIFILFLFLLKWIWNLPLTNETILMKLMGIGFGLGFTSHIFLDMMTYAGIPCITFNICRKIFPFFKWKNIRIVPKLRMFSTDTVYEDFMRSVLRATSYFLILYIVLDIYKIDLGVEITNITNIILDYIK